MGRLNPKENYFPRFKKFREISNFTVWEHWLEELVEGVGGKWNVYWSL